MDEFMDCEENPLVEAIQTASGSDIPTANHHTARETLPGFSTASDQQEIIAPCPAVRQPAQPEPSEAEPLVGTLTLGPPATLPADSKQNLSAIIAQLAALSSPEYDRRRKTAAKALGMRVTILDKEVAAHRGEKPKNSPEGNRLLGLQDPDPWPEPVAGADLLTALCQVFVRYCVLPEGGAVACALWVLHTYCHAAARISPILAISSPEKRCGKTTLLSLLRALVRRPLPTSNISPAALFRTIEHYQPTLLIDEADTFLKDSDMLRGILNSGHTRDTAQVIRTSGENYDPCAFSTWAPKAIALIGTLPSTLADRSVIIALRRKRPEERVDRLRLDRLDALHALPRRCWRWAQDHSTALAASDPPVPEGLNDRAADNWRPLLAIADRCGDDWPMLARQTLGQLSSTEENEETVSIQLLEDIQQCFAAAADLNLLPSAALVAALADKEHRPWPEWLHGRPITPRQVARLLKPFGITPKDIRCGNWHGKGYQREQFDDAFARYLPNSSATP